MHRSLFAALAILAAAPAMAALPNPKAEKSIALMPPATEVRMASRAYPVTSLALTNHKGWIDTSGYANVAQTAKLTWHIDRGGEGVLQVRDAWDAKAPWREVERWNGKQPEKGTTEVVFDRPTLFWLRVRAPKFPRSGIAKLRMNFERRTVAVLRGPAGAVKRPIILAEGYDPFNEYDMNDAAWQEEPTLAGVIAQGRQKYSLDGWLLDWGDAAAPIQQQAEDFAEIARQIREWNGGREETVAAGISMGAVTLRYALAHAYAAKQPLGVRKYLSINGPHQGAWVNPKLLQFLLKRAGPARSDSDLYPEASETFLIHRSMGSAAAQQLLMVGAQHERFYKELRAQGENGYDPTIPRVAFSNGTLVREGENLVELSQGKRETLHRIRIRPLFLPIWVTVHKAEREFKYGGYPGELLGQGMRRPVRDHVRYFGIFRFDMRADWESVPTFIPTHSALDFPEELTPGTDRFRYSRWKESSFDTLYVAAGRNLAHDQTDVDWINPRTGKAAPEGQNAILFEIANAFVRTP